MSHKSIIIKTFMILSFLCFMVSTFDNIPTIEARQTSTLIEIHGQLYDEKLPFHPNTRYLDLEYVKKISKSKAPYNPVPLKNLQNYSLLHWNLTDEQLKQSYDMAVKLLEPCQNLKIEDKLRCVAAVLRRYFDRYMTYSTSAPHWLDAYGFFILRSASCQGSACATGLCLNILGISYEHVNHNKWTHQWARVKVGNTYWICDPYGLYVGPELVPYKHPYF